MNPKPKRRRLSPDQETHGLGQNGFLEQAAEWNLEQDYERRSRKRKTKEPTRLPIKTQEGRVESLPGIEVQDSSSEILDDDETSQNAIPEAADSVPIEQQIVQAKEEMARVALQIHEDPEEHPGGFRVLAQIGSHPNPTVRKLVLVTQMTVYKDAIPGYRIRPIVEADQTEKVSKEVKRLRAYEQSLVTSYQAYLKTLTHFASQAPKSNAASGPTLASVAVACACNLLLAVPHFNFRQDLLQIVLARLGKRRRDDDFDKCLETLKNFFHNDDDGTPALDAVTILTKMMKTSGWQIEESVLNSFLHLRLLSEFSAKGSYDRVEQPEDQIGGKKAKVKREFRTKRQRKMLKERKEVEKEFQEADAIVSHEHRDRMQAETLKLVFVTYFRILKAKVPQLSGAVLEGLAKYAHLINQDFFGDILEVLQELLRQSEDREDHRIRESLLCITTAFTLLEGQDVAKSATALSLDLTFFITYLYGALHTLAMFPDMESSAKPYQTQETESDARINVQTTTVLLLRALHSILTSRNVAPVRLAAFTKQLYLCMLHFPEKSNLALLGLLGKVIRQHSRKVAALWNTEERRGNGTFDSSQQNLEGSNPFAANIWEGELLRLHFSPQVRTSARDVELLVR